MDLKTAVHWTAFDLKLGIWDLVINKIAASSLTTRILRYVIYRAAGLRVDTPALSPGIYFSSRNVIVGRRSFINRGCEVYCGGADVNIGAGVQIGMNVVITTDTHEIGPPHLRAQARIVAKPVSIGDGCWVGANATILPGVAIGTGCVIAAGAVVIRDCEPNGMYAGVPAQRIKTLPVDSV